MNSIEIVLLRGFGFGAYRRIGVEEGGKGPPAVDAHVLVMILIEHDA